MVLPGSRTSLRAAHGAEEDLLTEAGRICQAYADPIGAPGPLALPRVRRVRDHGGRPRFDAARHCGAKAAECPVRGRRLTTVERCSDHSVAESLAAVPEALAARLDAVDWTG